MSKSKSYGEFEGLSNEDFLLKALKVTQEGEDIFDLSNPLPVKWVYRKPDDASFNEGLVHHYHLVISAKNKEEAETAKELLKPFEMQWREEKHDDIKIECTKDKGFEYYSIAITGLDKGRLVKKIGDRFQKETKHRHKGYQTVINYNTAIKKKILEEFEQWPKDETGMPLVAVLATTAFNESDTISTITANCNTEKFINAQLTALKDKNIHKNGLSIKIEDISEAHKVHDFLHASLGIGTSPNPVQIKVISSQHNLETFDSGLRIIYDKSVYSKFTQDFLDKGAYQSRKRLFFEKAGKEVPDELSPSMFIVIPLDKLMYRFKQYSCTEEKQHEFLKDYLGNITDPKFKESEEKFFTENFKKERLELQKMKDAGFDYASKSPESLKRLKTELESAVEKEHNYLSELCGYDTRQKLTADETFTLSDSSEEVKSEKRGREMQKTSHSSRSSSREKESWREKMNSRSSSIERE